MIFSNLFLIVGIIGCAEDPILAKASSQNSSTKSVQQSKQEKQPVIPVKPTETLTKSVIPKIEPPTIAPPKEQSDDEVPPPPPNPKDGEFITIKGTIDAHNPNNRPIRIDIFDGDQQNIGGKRPSVVVSTTIEKGTTFEIALPKEEQMLWLGAYIDEDGDGRPGPNDPSGWFSGNPVSGNQDRSQISLQLGIPNNTPP